MDNGEYGIRVRVRCCKKKCNRYMTAYLAYRNRSLGTSFVNAHGKSGKRIGDLRDQIYVCQHHMKKRVRILSN